MIGALLMVAGGLALLALGRRPASATRSPATTTSVDRRVTAFRRSGSDRRMTSRRYMDKAAAIGTLSNTIQIYPPIGPGGPPPVGDARSIFSSTYNGPERRKYNRRRTNRRMRTERRIGLRRVTGNTAVTKGQFGVPSPIYTANPIRATSWGPAETPNINWNR